MGKRLQHVTPHKSKREGTPRGQSVPHARPLRGAYKRLKQVEAIWESFPEGLIACDHNQKIVCINAAARKLFEVASESQFQGRDYQQFLTPYIRSDEQPAYVSRGQWLMNLVLPEETGASSPVQALLLHLPSGHRLSVTVRSFLVGGHGRDMGGSVSIFRCGYAISHLQRVHEAMLELINATAQIPEQMEHVLPEETFLLSPPVLFVAQQVVDVIRSVLDCYRVNMLAFGRRSGHLYVVAGSGYTPEQEQYWQDIGGLFHLSEMLDDAAFARLSANQEAVRPLAQLHVTERFGKQLPFPAYLRRVPPDSETFLLLPLFLDHQWVGVLFVVRADMEGAYTPEEIALAKAVTAQTMMLIEAIHYLYAQEEQQQKALVQREVSRLAGDFLTLASHELRTPLTGIMGNLQLAQHRLETFKDRCPHPSARMYEPLAYVRQPLAVAEQSAQLQRCMINNLIDDAHIQTNTLTLSLKPEDLCALLREVVGKQQQATPEHPIVLDVPSPEQKVPILADAGRIKHVLTSYLTNALTASPPGRPVEVQLRVEGALARVSVHNEGAGIAREDLDHLWERFYRTKGNAVQHELDLSCGLPLYLCRVFMERHQGSVGVQSIPGQGATFWFTMPITPSLGT